MIRLVNAIYRGGIHMATAYLYDSVGLRHQRNLDLLQDLAGRLRDLKAPWIVAADWNATLDDLRASGWLSLTGGNHPAATTHLQWVCH